MVIGYMTRRNGDIARIVRTGKPGKEEYWADVTDSCWDNINDCFPGTFETAGAVRRYLGEFGFLVDDDMNSEDEYDALFDDDNIY